MKKILAVILSLMILICLSTSLAAFDDVSQTANYYDAVQRVTGLGLMDGLDEGAFKPGVPTTRGQLAQAIAISAGLWDTAEKMKGATKFVDVPDNGTYNGFINVCIKEGYMTGLAESRFAPDSSVTFAQAVTAMVRVLGYKDADLPGTWPKNYIKKAETLGLTANLPTGTQMTPNSTVTRSVMAQMLDNLLDIEVKSSDPQSSSKTLAEASGLSAGSIYTVYSKPEVFLKSMLVNNKIGSIDLSGVSIVKNSVDNSTNPATVTNGKAVTIDGIEDYDVVYQVSDKSGKNRYILVVGNRLTGTLTGILPDKFLPQKIEIDGKAYELDKSFDKSKLSGSDSLSLNDTVTVLFGRDGKAVDIQGTVYEDNSNFALVVNYTMPSVNQYVNNGTKRTVKLMLTDGTVKTFETASNPTELKGRLVKFTKNDDGSVTIGTLNYTSQSEVNIDKVNKRILYSNNYYSNNYYNNNYYSNDVADNVKIFNITALNDKDTYEDTKAEMLNWSELPSGFIESGKVLYLNKAGIFDDINIILLNNIEAADVHLGIVKGYQYKSVDKKPYSYTVAIDGKDYTYSTDTYISSLQIDKVVRARLSGNIISEVVEILEPDTSANVIQAVDKERIRVNNRTYEFSDNCMVYLLKNQAIPEKIEISNLWTETVSGDFRIYTDASFVNGGKAELIVIKSY